MSKFDDEIKRIKKELEEIPKVFGGFCTFRRWELEAQLRILEKINEDG